MTNTLAHRIRNRKNNVRQSKFLYLTERQLES